MIKSRYNGAIALFDERSEIIFNHYGVNLKKGKGKCPFHDDKKPSFIAKPDSNGKWYWSCMACGAKGGDIISFVAQKEGLNEQHNFADIIKICAEICGICINTAPNAVSTPKPPTQQAPPPPIYLNTQTISMAIEVERTALYKYLSPLFSADAVKRVMAQYKCGLGHNLYKDKDWKMSDSPIQLQNCRECAAFPYIDTNGNVHSIKVVPYDKANGHRIKGKRSGADMQLYKPQQNKGAYFGTHLLADSTTAPIAIVESEKSALIGALFAPNFIWIATGGKEYLGQNHIHKLEPFKGRVIHVYPDADAVEDWRKHVDDMRSNGYNVIYRDDIIAKYPPESKIDIADLMIWEILG